MGCFESTPVNNFRISLENLRDRLTKRQNYKSSNRIKNENKKNSTSKFCVLSSSSWPKLTGPIKLPAVKADVRKIQAKLEAEEIFRKAVEKIGYLSKIHDVENPAKNDNQIMMSKRKKSKHSLTLSRIFSQRQSDFVTQPKSNYDNNNNNSSLLYSSLQSDGCSSEESTTSIQSLNSHFSATGKLNTSSSKKSKSKTKKDHYLNQI